MTLEITLPEELETRLRQEAQRQGLSPDAVTVRLLDQHLPAAGRRAALITLLHQWTAEEQSMSDEESAANAEVLRAIDQDRLSDRPLFAGILKDHSQ